MKSSRHVSRFIAINIVYAKIVAPEFNANLAELKQKIINCYLDRSLFHYTENAEANLLNYDDSYLDILLDLYFTSQTKIETIIQTNLSEKYKFQRLDKVIVAALSIACAELLYAGETPVKVIIDEYVTLISMFYSEKEAGFVNKLLDIISKELRHN
jgi:hypothetical protein